MKRIVPTVVACVVLSTTGLDAVQDVSFWAPFDFAVLSPWAVAAADLNGDGKSDVAVTNFENASVSVLLNGGGGHIVAVGVKPAGVAITDFNGDARADLAIAESGGESVAVLLGTGDGTFQDARHFPAGPSPQLIAVTDFNGDHNPDVVVSTQTGGTVLLGDGDGSLVAAMPFGLLDVPMSLVVGDFDDDTDVDIAASFGLDRIALLRGKGDGTFFPAIFMEVGRSWAIVAGDFDDDGRLDLAAGLGGQGGLFNHLGVFLGNGDGTFEQPLLTVVFLASITALAVGDFNKDSSLDLAANGDGGATVYLGLGGGRMSLHGNVIGNGASSIAVTDLNGDTNADLVFAGWRSTDGYPVGTLCIRFGREDATFVQTPGLRANVSPNEDLANAINAVSVADFNGDGTVDVASAMYLGYYIAVVLGNGDGTFRPGPGGLRTNSFEVQAMAAADVDGDSRVDLVAVADGIYLFRGRGDGSLERARLIAPVSYSSRMAVLVNDLDGENGLDLIVRDRHSVLVLMGTGSGSFQAPHEVAVGLNPSDVGVEDFNNDMVPDLAVVTSGSGSVSIALGNGDGTFQPPITTAVGNAPSSVAAADFDEDGRMDVAVVHDGVPQHVRVLKGTGDGTFQPAVGHYYSANPGGTVRAEDFNGDRHVDLAVLNANTLSILVGNGDGTLRLQATGFSTVAFPTKMAFADFTSDGRLDVAVAGDARTLTRDSVAIALLYNATPPTDDSVGRHEHVDDTRFAASPMLSREGRRGPTPFSR